MNDAAVAESMEEEKPVEAEAEQEETKPTEASEEEAKEPSESSPEKKDSVQGRIDEITRKFRTEERQRIELEQKIAQLEEQAQNPTETPKPDKTLADFDYDEAQYSAYLVKFATEAAREEATRAATEHQARQRNAEFSSKESEFSESVDDYHAITRNPNLAISEAMLSAIQASDEGPATLYYLGKNPEISAQLASMDALTMAVELGRIQATELKKPEPEVTKAPPPTPKLEGVENPQKVDVKTSDGDKLSTTDWMKARRKQLRK